MHMIRFESKSPRPQTPARRRSAVLRSPLLHRLLVGALLLLVAQGVAVQTIAAQTAAEEAAQPAPFDSGTYRIGANDLLNVEVFGLDDFDRKVRVLRDGTISLPMLGSVAVEGMSLEAAQAEIARLLSAKRLVRDPQVSLFVEEYLSRGVSIQGAVQRPGVYQMLGPKSLLEVIGEAGGLSGREGERAGRQIFVVRRDSSGQQTRLELDARRLVGEGDPTLNIPLQPGDVVVVPFDRKQRVYVSGAVQNPGAVEFLESEGISLLQAITAAGGPSERAKLSRVAIKRRLDNGQEEQIQLNLKRIKNGKDPDVPLQQNDTVVVGDWFF
jgi:polysaccharide export outer membrane protein